MICEKSPPCLAALSMCDANWRPQGSVVSAQVLYYTFLLSVVAFICLALYTAARHLPLGGGALMANTVEVNGRIFGFRRFLLVVPGDDGRLAGSNRSSSSSSSRKSGGTRIRHCGEEFSCTSSVTTAPSGSRFRDTRSSCTALLAGRFLWYFEVLGDKRGTNVKYYPFHCSSIDVAVNGPTIRRRVRTASLTVRAPYASHSAWQIYMSIPTLNSGG